MYVTRDNLLTYIQKNVIDEVMIKLTQDDKANNSGTDTDVCGFRAVELHIALDYTRCASKPDHCTKSLHTLYDYKYQHS